MYSSRRGIHDHHHRHHSFTRPASSGGAAVLAGVFRAQIAAMLQMKRPTVQSWKQRDGWDSVAPSAVSK
ncbi:terminase gpP N-terminus-related DNA-binding protein [Escherichia coli]|uniref:terminase gpP N-terminus-related DNA-binding protein n=1 Tax=Escherichia coli TaxID=562 RepID=UPI00336BBF3F